eukprot:1158959-Pelagomonas_calceolata.AAC.13
MERAIGNLETLEAHSSRTWLRQVFLLSVAHTAVAGACGFSLIHIPPTHKDRVPSSLQSKVTGYRLLYSVPPHIPPALVLAEVHKLKMASTCNTDVRVTQQWSLCCNPLPQQSDRQCENIFDKLCLAFERRTLGSADRLLLQ